MTEPVSLLEQLPGISDSPIEPAELPLQVDIDKLILVLGITFGFIFLLLLSILCIFYTMGVLQNVFGYYWGPPMGPIMTIPHFYPTDNSDNYLLPSDLPPGLRMDCSNGGGQFNQMVINNAGASIHDLSIQQQQQYQQQQFQQQFGPNGGIPQMNGFLSQITGGAVGQHFVNNVHHHPSSIMYSDNDDLDDDVPIDIRRSNSQFQVVEKEIELEC